MKSKKLHKDFCEICKTTDKKILHHHHIIERTELNTSNDSWNLAVLCPTCHAKVHSKEIEIIGVFPSTHEHGRFLVYKINGIPNVPGIIQPYLPLKNKGIKIC